MEKYKLYLGDVLENIVLIPDNSVDSVVTDPPYGISIADKEWDSEIPGVNFWKEELRILKPGGHIAAFSSPKTYHHLAIAIENAGFEIRDQLLWLFSDGMKKGSTLQNEYSGLEHKLKPAHEPICLARKPFSGTLIENLDKYFTGALNPQKVNGRTATNLMHDDSDSLYEIFPYNNDKTKIKCEHSGIKKKVLLKTAKILCLNIRKKNIIQYIVNLEMSLNIFSIQK